MEVIRIADEVVTCGNDPVAGDFRRVTPCLTTKVKYFKLP